MQGPWQVTSRLVIVALAVALFAAPTAIAQTWFPPESLSADTQDAYSTRLATNAQGDAVVAWTRTTGGTSRIQVSSRDGSDGSYTAPTTISGTGGDDASVAVDDDGDAIVVWSLYDGTNLRIQYSIGTAGGSFGNEQSISDAGQDAYDADVGMDGAGNAIVTWARNDGSNGSVCCGRIQAVTRPAGGSFGSIVTLSDPDQNAYQPEIKTEPGGEASIVWTRSDGTHLRVQTARLLEGEGYPRPNGAAKARVTLVPAFQACTAPNTAHGLPLDEGSCSPAVPTSTNLTVPNDDSSVANGFMTIKFNCTNAGIPPDCGAVDDQADVTMIVTVRDIRCRAGHSVNTSCGAVNTSPGEDYTGNLLARPSLRLTDLWSYGGAATTTDTQLPVGVPCTGTAAVNQGSTCNINTSIDAIVPNMARENKRAIWQLSAVKIYDAGNDGSLVPGTIGGGGGVCPPACLGSGDEQVFQTQALFVP